MGLFSKKKELWFPLDNAAKIYPPTASQKRAHVFCFSALLDNEIQSDFLIKAIENVLNHYPTFKTSLKRGTFWYYLEENKKPIKVFPADLEAMPNATEAICSVSAWQAAA